MKRVQVIIVITMVMVAGIFTKSAAMRGLLEKEVHYLSQGSIKDVSYWALYFGDYDCSLIRKYPGEDSLPVATTLNLSLLSNGYIEARGYSAKGKMDADVKLAIQKDDKVTTVSMGEIDCIYDYGTRIRLKNGTEGDFMVDIEQNPFPAKKLQLRRYYFEDVYGEKVLKEENPDKTLIVRAVAFTPEGVQFIKSLPAE